MGIVATQPSVRHLPGDRRGSGDAARAAMVRVDQAGEYGAARIYAGQLAVMGGRGRVAGEIRHMAAQEQHHLDVFNRMMTERRVRPTLLAPFWHVAGYALGAGTALLGPRAAMAATVAVETVIDAHYGDQSAALADGSDPELKAAIDQFQADEIEHRDTAAGHSGDSWPVLQAIIRAGCHAAIATAKRI